ncbi:MAG: HIT family protein [Gordonia sp. (in: high G+C Gram-positive bacteria)]|uniref:HIT family protein n=1 Tax=Gordonia sp. (in: high G+C Gram-positive bacteria) TaxID=84139 RepID=UPI0039E3F197
MASVFSMIIHGDLPGRFVWRDERAVVFLTINPVTDGHVLVVPIEEVDHWESVESGLFEHLTDLARTMGQAVKKGFDAPRAGLIIAGLEVPHLHLHVFPAWRLEDFSFASAAADPDPADLDKAAETIRATLREMGLGANVPDA